MMLFYQYIFHACQRGQIYLGSPAGELVKWRAEVLLLIPMGWLALSAAMWIKAYTAIDLLALPSVAVAVCTAAVVFFLQRRFLGTQENQKSYQELFDSWPARKRLRFDFGVVAFFVLSAGIFVLSATATAAVT